MPRLGGTTRSVKALLLRLSLETVSERCCELLEEGSDFIGIRREDFPQFLQVYKENRFREILIFFAFALIPVVTAIGIEITLASIIICAAERDAIENYANHLGSD